MSSSVYIPEEIVFAILLQLPVKYLLRFKSVCKAWKSLISNFDFEKLHMTNPNNDYFIAHNFSDHIHTLSFINTDKSMMSFNFPKPDSTDHSNFEYLYSIRSANILTHRKGFNMMQSTKLDLPKPTSTHRHKNKFNIVGCCNGLLCLTYKRRRSRYGERFRLYLWNPATRQLKDIYYKCTDDYSSNYSFSLGFGFDLATSDYKVVRMRKYHYDCSRRHVQLYSLNQDSWKRIEVEMKFTELNRCVCDAIVKGLPYWFGEDQSVKVLVSFDVQSEKFSTIALPDGICHKFPPKIFDFKESVAIIARYCPNSDTKIWRVGVDEYCYNMWTLDDGSCWIKHSIIKSPVLGDIHGCLKTGEFVAHYFWGDQNVLYDHAHKVVKHFQHGMDSTLQRTYNYSESLVNLYRPPCTSLPKKG